MQLIVVMIADRVYQRCVHPPLGIQEHRLKHLFCHRSFEQRPLHLVFLSILFVHIICALLTRNVLDEEFGHHHSVLLVCLPRHILWHEVLIPARLTLDGACARYCKHQGLPALHPGELP